MTKHFNPMWLEEPDKSKWEYTFALIKPDVVEYHQAGQIITEMEKHFIVCDGVLMTWSRSFLMQFYAEHYGKEFFEPLIEFMSSGPMYAMTLVRPNAVQHWRNLIGPTDPRKSGVGMIRGLYGDQTGVIMRNAVHGSDSKQRAFEEMMLVRRLFLINFGDGALRTVERYSRG